MASLAWLQCSTWETQLLQYFDTVFLEILNVPLSTVFTNPVTYNSNAYDMHTFKELTI